jgi:pSer/pThr/pTyr-binding forkhead associated (FHA) protein
MERVVIKHLSGSKANQEVSFPLDQVPEISLGRDAASTVAYDMERDDAVSRNHARITRDPAQNTVFILTDLGSRNGVFVNQSRIAGSTALHHGDVVQLGAGGPEFSFQMDPPPALTPKATRQIDLRQGTPTREISLGTAASADVRPQRVVLRHMTGSKANQEVSFPVAPTTEITFGRDPAASVSYDAERDDTVSRNHATIKRDSQQKGFTLVDLNSRNGVFVNGARIRDSVTLHHGDLIQFGAGGARAHVPARSAACRRAAGDASVRSARGSADAGGDGRPGRGCKHRQRDSRCLGDDARRARSGQGDG